MTSGHGVCSDWILLAQVRFQTPSLRTARVVPGEIIVDPRTSSDAGLGTVVVTGATTDEAERAFGDVVSWVQAASQVDRIAG